MMNIERLLLRINAVLDGAAEGFEARALAAEYAGLSENVRERMRQCAALIKSGNDNAALQVAEAPPPVLDLAAKLAFARAEEWRTYCKENRLPTPHRLDAPVVDQVNGLYSKEIGESHPLYRDYRAAMREHDDLRALGVLRSISRVNSSDKNAKEEFERLSAKLRREMLLKLRETHAHRQDNAMFGVMAEMEHAGLAPCPDAPEWVEACKVRDAWDAKKALGEAIRLIPQIIALRDAGEWEPAIPLLGQARALQMRYGFRWPKDEGDIITHAETWVAGHAAVVDKLRREEEKTEDLYRRLEEMEKRASGPARARQFLVADLQTAEAWLAEAAVLPESANFHAPIVRAKHVRSQIKGQLHRLRNRLITLSALGATAAAVLLITGAWMARSAAGERDFLTRLGEAEAATRQTPVLAFLAGPARLNPELVAANATRVGALRERADTADRAWRALRAEAEAILKAASAPNRGSPQALRSRAKALLAAAEKLPADLREESQPDFDKAALAADEFALKTPSAALTKILAQPAPGLAAAPEFLALRDALRIALDAPGAARAECVLAARGALAAADAFAALASARDAAFAKLDTARSLETHAAALAAIAALDEDTPATRAARSAGAGIESLRDALTAIATPEGAAWLRAAGSPGVTPAFIATEPTAAEAAAAGRIAAATRFAGVWRATKVSYANGVRTESNVLLKGRPTFERIDLSAGTETRVQADQFNADGSIARLRLFLRKFAGRPASGETLEGAVATKEGELLAELAGFYDADRTSFGLAPLGALDRVLSSGADPLLKGWLHRELLAILSERPAVWGLDFAPEAGRDAARLRDLPVAALDATSWLTPEKSADVRRSLAAFHDTKRTPHLPAATFRLALARTLLACGLPYAGRTDAEARPGAVTGTPGERLIGLGANGKPEVVGVIAANGAASLTRPCAALSPLLRAPGTLGAPGQKAPEGLTPPDGDWINLFLPKP